MKAVILVGGEGTRLRPLTYSTVKAMVPILNKPFIEHLVNHLSSHNIEEIILALGYKPDSIRSYFGNANQMNTKLVYSVESTPLGTAGAVKNAEQHIKDVFFILNGDVFTDIDLSEMLKFHKKKHAMVTIALTPVDDPTRFGVVETDGQQRITRFIEKPGWQQVTSHLINAGIYILEPEVLKHIPAGEHCMFEHDVFPKLLSEGDPVFSYATDCYWIDMGTPEKYLQLSRDLLYGKSSQVIFKPEDICIDKQSSTHPNVNLTGPIMIDRDCTIGEDVHLKGPVVVGSGCNIHNGAHIENSILWNNVRIGEKSVLKNCIVASDNLIENNALFESATINNNALAKK